MIYCCRGHKYQTNSFIALFFLFLIQPMQVDLIAQVKSEHSTTPDHCVRFMFYNVQNLFDVEDDQKKDDDDFSSGGAYNWNEYRLNQKINLLYKVIADLGGWQPPGLIALCEVETRELLYRLLETTPLINHNYGIVHFDSDDRRGIDVALIYRRDIFLVLESRVQKIEPGNKEGWKTRDILIVHGIMNNMDTLTIMINHWPSRYGGIAATAGRRAISGEVLAGQIIQSIGSDPGAKIIITGDFNDPPDGESILNKIIENPELSNQISLLDGIPDHHAVKGSYKFQGIWYLFDQIWVTKNLLGSVEGIFLKENHFTIHGKDFFLTEDDAYLGLRPWKTYHGLRYEGGVSDHLPVYIDLCTSH